MQINITGHHIDLSPALRQYVEAKFKRVERHFDHLNDIHVVLSVEKQRHRAEATIHVSGGKIFADAENGDMYTAIDVMVGKLDRQVKKHKEKLTDHHQEEGGLKTQTLS